MGIPTARFSLLTGGGKIPDHDNEDGHSGDNHDHVDEDDSHSGLSCSLGDLLLNYPEGIVLAGIYFDLQTSQKVTLVSWKFAYMQKNHLSSSMCSKNVHTLPIYGFCELLTAIFHTT